MSTYFRSSDYRRRCHQADNGHRPRRIDTGQQFLDAGYRQDDRNPNVWHMSSYGFEFRVSPGCTGLKVTGETMHEPQVFAYGTSPTVIADWIVSYAQTRYQAENDE